MITKEQAVIFAGKLAKGLEGIALDTAIVKLIPSAHPKDIDLVASIYDQAELDNLLDIKPTVSKTPTLTPDQLKQRKIVADIKAKAEAKKTGPKKSGVGQLQVSLIREGKPNAEVLALVLKAYPEAKTTIACVAWYRSKMRAGRFGGLDTPTNREVKANIQPVVIPVTPPVVKKNVKKNVKK